MIFGHSNMILVEDAISRDSDLTGSSFSSLLVLVHVLSQPMEREGRGLVILAVVLAAV